MIGGEAVLCNREVTADALEQLKSVETIKTTKSILNFSAFYNELNYKPTLILIPFQENRFMNLFSWNGISVFWLTQLYF